MVIFVIGIIVIISSIANAIRDSELAHLLLGLLGLLSLTMAYFICFAVSEPVAELHRDEFVEISSEQYNINAEDMFVDADNNLYVVTDDSSIKMVGKFDDISFVDSDISYVKNVKNQYRSRAITLLIGFPYEEETVEVYAPKDSIKDTCFKAKTVIR